MLNKISGGSDGDEHSSEYKIFVLVWLCLFFECCVLVPLLPFLSVIAGRRITKKAINIRSQK